MMTTATSDAQDHAPHQQRCVSGPNRENDSAPPGAAPGNPDGLLLQKLRDLESALERSKHARETVAVSAFRSQASAQLNEKENVRLLGVINELSEELRGLHELYQRARAEESKKVLDEMREFGVWSPRGGGGVGLGGAATGPGGAGGAGTAGGAAGTGSKLSNFVDSLFGGASGSGASGGGLTTDSFSVALAGGASKTGARGNFSSPSQQHDPSQQHRRRVRSQHTQTFDGDSYFLQLTANAERLQRQQMAEKLHEYRKELQSQEELLREMHLVERRKKQLAAEQEVKEREGKAREMEQRVREREWKAMEKADVEGTFFRLVLLQKKEVGGYQRKIIRLGEEITSMKRGFEMELKEKVVVSQALEKDVELLIRQNGELRENLKMGSEDGDVHSGLREGLECAFFRAGLQQQARPQENGGQRQGHDQDESRGQHGARASAIGGGRGSIIVGGSGGTASAAPSGFGRRRSARSSTHLFENSPQPIEKQVLSLVVETIFGPTAAAASSSDEDVLQLHRQKDHRAEDSKPVFLPRAAEAWLGKLVFRLHKSRLFDKLLSDATAQLAARKKAELAAMMSGSGGWRSVDMRNDGGSSRSSSVGSEGSVKSKNSRDSDGNSLLSDKSGRSDDGAAKAARVSNFGGGTGSTSFGGGASKNSTSVSVQTDLDGSVFNEPQFQSWLAKFLEFNSNSAAHRRGSGQRGYAAGANYRFFLSDSSMGLTPTAGAMGGGGAGASNNEIVYLTRDFNKNLSLNQSAATASPAGKKKFAAAVREVMKPGQFGIFLQKEPPGGFDAESRYAEPQGTSVVPQLSTSAAPVPAESSSGAAGAGTINAGVGKTSSSAGEYSSTFPGASAQAAASKSRTEGTVNVASPPSNKAKMARILQKHRVVTKFLGAMATTGAPSK